MFYIIQDSMISLKYGYMLMAHIKFYVTSNLKAKKVYMN